MNNCFYLKNIFIFALCTLSLTIHSLTFAFSTPKVKWTYDVSSLADQSAQIKAGPVVDRNGTIYITTTNKKASGRVIALTPDGKKKWECGSDCALLDLVSSPIVADDGSVYVTSKDTVYALNSEGKLKWSRHLGGYEISTIAVDHTGLLLIGQINTLHAYDANGNEKWQFTNQFGQLFLKPDFATDGTIYATTPLFLYAIDHDGNLKWSMDRTYGGYSGASVGRDGTIYLIDPIAVVAVNPDGTKKWLVELETFAMDGSAPAYSPTIGKDGTIYFDAFATLHKRRLYAFTPQGGIRWIGPVLAEDNGACLVRSPVVAPNGTINLLMARYYETANKIMIVNEDGSIKTRDFDLSECPKFLSVGIDGTLYTSSIKKPNLLFAISV